MKIPIISCFSDESRKSLELHYAIQKWVSQSQESIRDWEIEIALIVQDYYGGAIVYYEHPIEGLHYWNTTLALNGLVMDESWDLSADTSHYELFYEAQHCRLAEPIGRDELLLQERIIVHSDGSSTREKISDRYERMKRHVEEYLEKSTPIQFRFVGEGQLMNREIQLPPFKQKDFEIPYGDPLYRHEEERQTSDIEDIPF